MTFYSSANFFSLSVFVYPKICGHFSTLPNCFSMKSCGFNISVSCFVKILYLLVLYLFCVSFLSDVVCEASTFRLASGFLPASFLFRRLTFFFRFTFVHTAQLKSKFLIDFCSLTALARVTSFLTLASKSF